MRVPGNHDDRARLRLCEMTRPLFTVRECLRVTCAECDSDLVRVGARFVERATAAEVGMRPAIVVRVPVGRPL